LITNHTSQAISHRIVIVEELRQKIRVWEKRHFSTRVAHEV